MTQTETFLVNKVRSACRVQELQAVNEVLRKETMSNVMWLMLEIVENETILVQFVRCG